MSPLGETLQKARQARGVTLDEVASETRISRRYLEALENENFGLLPAPVYARGFLRIYSRYLGLDPAELLPLFPVGYIDEPRLEPWPKVKTPATWPSSGLLAGVVVSALILIVLLLYSVGGQGESGSQSFFGAQTGTPDSETGIAAVVQTPEGGAAVVAAEETATGEAVVPAEETPAVTEEETPAPPEEGATVVPVVVPPGTIPDLRGLSLDQALATLQAMDVSYLVVQVRSSTVQLGYVIRQNPSPGTDVEADEVVTLEVSRGP